MTKKTCPTCKVEKNLSEYRKDTRRLDKHRSDCKICARLFQKQKSKYHINQAENRKKRWNENSIFIADIKQKSGCKICKSEFDPPVLSFHHLDSNEKDFAIGSGKSQSIEIIKAEIAKCIVVCHNCHAKIHAGIITSAHS